MTQAIRQLQDAGVEPDVWKVEGLDDRAHYEDVVATARRGGRDRSGASSIGRGEDDAKVHDWLRTRGRGAGLHRVRGRPHDVLGPPDRLAAQKTTREAAVAEIARRYREWVGIFENARSTAGVAAAH